MDYASKNILELKFIARQRNIRNYMKMKKEKLVSMLEANDMDPTLLRDTEFDEECKAYTTTWKQNNPERVLIYKDKFRKGALLYYHKRKQEVENHCDLDRKDYENMNLHELKYIGRNRKMKYCDIMNKNKLIEMLKINDDYPSIKNDPEFDKICKEINLIKSKKHREKIRQGQ